MSLDIVVYDRLRPWSKPWEQAFRDGLDAHRVAYERRPIDSPRPCDLAVVWSHNCPQVQEQARDYLVMEQCYFGSGFVSLGYNGLNGLAEFHNEGSPGDRWERHGWELPDWGDGDCVVLMGQVPGDASLRGVDYHRWAREAVSKLCTTLPVYYRKHPRAFDFAPPCTPLKGSLAECLERAAWVVTYNSNSGVDAALAGVPVVAMDRGSMAWPVAGHELSEPPRPDRTQWVRDLAYCQWTLEEVSSGEAWEHLRKRYEL